MRNTRKKIIVWLMIMMFCTLQLQGCATTHENHTITQQNNSKKTAHDTTTTSQTAKIGATIIIGTVVVGVAGLVLLKAAAESMASAVAHH